MILFKKMETVGMDFILIIKFINKKINIILIII